MKILNDVELSKKTTFRVGGKAKDFYIPENINELQKLLIKLQEKEYYIISGGSNILINDKKIFDNVISMELVDNTIENQGNGVFYIGASNRIQHVIKYINSCEYGGIEEMYSLPAMFGGIIYMNAGIGSKTNTLFSISDFIVKVKVINKKDKKIIWLKNEECVFQHRKSVFQKNEYIILGAECRFNRQSIEESEIKIKNRIQHCKNTQEWGSGCFGTCFSEANRKILKTMSLMDLKHKGIYQSKLNSNWLVNDGHGTYKEAMKIIRMAEKLHKICHKKIEREIIIWD